MKRPLEESTEGDASKRRREGEEAMMEDEEDDVMKEDEADEEEDAMKEDERQVEEEFRLDEDLLFEVFKHMDARTLGTAACVSRQWHRTAMDERLWEIICNRHWANTGCSTGQLRSVVLALGGFRRLHSLYIWPFIKPPPSSSPSSSSYSSGPLSISRAPLSVAPPSASARWGKDEVHLSLSLLSIRYYEKMNPSSSQQQPHLPTGGGILQSPKR
ncbi:F-box protein GID2-like [Nymphaea colorata]|uniref:F-box protein GID2 n=1 Tax=Nymphaea colorata TaxID=210225 RepID=A0A5K1GXR6_9MAGN|nr:F-box protein GID2-like [Nymphaea colorata]